MESGDVKLTTTFSIGSPNWSLIFIVSAKATGHISAVKIQADNFFTILLQIRPDVLIFILLNSYCCLNHIGLVNLHKYFNIPNLTEFLSLLFNYLTI